MFGISFEHIIIVGVILLIVGPKRLPQLGNTMGKAIKNFKDSISGIEEANFKRLKEEASPLQPQPQVQPQAQPEAQPAQAEAVVSAPTEAHAEKTNA